MRKKRSYMARWLYSYIVALLYCYVAALLVSPVYAEDVLASSSNRISSFNNRIIVKFKQPEGMAHKIGAMVNQGMSLKSKLLLDNTFSFEVPVGEVERIVQALETDPLVEYAEVVHSFFAHAVPNDPEFSKQWGLTKILAPEAWDLTSGSSSVKVAILDTGIDKDHPDLSSKVDQWVNFTSSSTEDDLFGHGTHTGGITAAATNNGVGVAGLGYDVRLLSVKVLNDKGSGDSLWIANGIKWAADNGAQVINLSLGGSGSQAMKEAIDYAVGKGVVVIASAGNCGQGGPKCPGVNPIEYPAGYSNVITVAATGSNDEKAGYSNYGSWVDVTAPGGNKQGGSSACMSQQDTENCILSTVPGGYTPMQGTSMSAPFVSGLAGLLFGANSSLTGSEVRSLIESEADKIEGTGTYWTHGRINAYQSVLAAMGDTTPTPTPTGGTIPTPTITPGGPTLTPMSTSDVTGTPTPTPIPFNCVTSGDFDENGTVDEADFTLWKGAFLSGNADLSCFEYWRRNRY